jgi:hypothetical protein
MAGFQTAGTAGRPGTVYTTAITPVGTIAMTTDQKECIFLKGVASTVAGSWVAFDEAYVTTLLNTSTAGSLVSQLAVASAATVASTYGWYYISGAVSASVGSAVADNGKLYASAADGVVEDAVSAGNQIHGAYARAATTTAAVLLSSVQISRPFIGVADAII